ncbi:MAG: kelch repeat-containing protein, partial [Chthoniobacterales bacterium]
LNDSGTDYIYCVGGSQVTLPDIFDRVFRYDPVTDVITTVAAPWPGGQGTTLPGGFTVFQNKLYILGGFDTIAGNATNQIWEFTPTTNVWVQKGAVLPVPLGYIPTTTIGSLIYTGGGSDITGGVLTDTTNSFVYNPVADSISTIASIPRATGETRALNFNGQMLVMGGGRTAPNPSNEVDVYDPGSDSWTVNTPVPAFVTARRNFPTDTDGTSRIWLAGGYDSSGATLLASMEIFECTTSGEITLSAKVRRQGGKRLVALSWTPADGGSIDVLRDHLVLRTVDDDGSAQDHLGSGPRETHVYQVCETDTGTCSNEVKVKIPGQ